MPPSALATGLEHFRRLSQSVYVHEPGTTSSPENHPDFILIAAWMGAAPRHIAKYTAGYEKLYPAARIVVITTSTIDAAFTTEAANVKRVTPVLDILYALPSNTKFLLHFFSNGGSFTVTLIAKIYRQKIGHPIPTTAIVLDSTPGKATYEATIRAFAVSLPKNKIIRQIGIAVLRIFYLLYRLNYLLTRKLDLVEKARRDLNDKSLLDVDTPRLYIYSVADAMVHWEYVEEHCEEAEKVGYVVDREKFQHSGHAGHLIQDEKRYWAAVVRLWSTV